MNSFSHFEIHTDDAVLEQFERLRGLNREGTKQWERQIESDVNMLFKKWGIYVYYVNRDAYSGLVLMCRSWIYGDVVLKMYPPFLQRRYIKETYIIMTLKDYPQAPLLELDEQRLAMLLKCVVPGDYIVYEEDQDKIASMFRQMQQNSIPSEEVTDKPQEIKGIVEQTEDEYTVAAQYDYYPATVKYLLDCAKSIYRQFFFRERKFLLHGDVYYKNALRTEDGIRVIDPVGYSDAFIFEYMPFLTYELVMHTKPQDYMDQYHRLAAFFSAFTDTSKFFEATFVFLVKQLVPSIYEANDGYRRADSYLQLIKCLFLDENNEIVLNRHTSKQYEING